MKPEEITDLFETMANTIRTVQHPPGRDLSGVPEHARPPVVPAPKVPEVGKDQLKEMFDPASDKFDPEGAFKLLAQKNYGQLFSDINLRSIKGLMSRFKSELPDFGDYEGDISKALETSGRDPATLTEQDVLNYYFWAKGAKVTVKEKQAAAAKATTTLPPTPKGEDKDKAKELSPVEEEIAHRMFRRIENPEERIKKYKEYAGYEDGITVKVPLGGGKTA